MRPPTGSRAPGRGPARIGGGKAKPAGAVLVAIVVLIAAALGLLNDGDPAPTQGGSPREVPRSTGGGTARDDTAAIARAFDRRESSLIVEAPATVKKVLPDDKETPRHQRLIVLLSNNRTVLIAHNIDLAPRVPAREGDTLRFRGEYEWNDQGGVIHWTHHDPGGRREGGWVEVDGERYE